MTALKFAILLCITALLGCGIGAVLSHIPGKRGPAWLRGLLLLPLGLGLFAGGLCLWARSADAAAVANRFFPDRLSKLAGCGLLLALFCVLGFLLGVLRARGPRKYFSAVSGSRLHRRTGLGILVCCLALVLGCTLLAGDPPPSPLRLNEICCGNFSMLADPDTGEYGDYIELINTGSEPVNLEGYFLSDNGKKRNRFRLPALELGPGECAVLWADGSGTSGKKSGQAIHLNFSLKEGDTLWFTSPHGVLLDRGTVPKPEKNISLTRMGEDWVQAYGTPGRANDAAVRFTPATLTAPTLSLASGFYEEPQTLTMTAASGCEIRYTLDGSLPSEESLLYTEPLTLRDISDQPNRVWSHADTTPDRSGVVTEPVDKGTVIRAAAFDGAGARSEAVTGVYFVGETFEKYRDRVVLSLTATPYDLFGTYGILVTGPDYDAWLEGGQEGWAPVMNFSRRGRAWERTAALTLWDENGTQQLDTLCGIRLQGGASRGQITKRFSLYARKLYAGSSVFPLQFFPGVDSHSVTTRTDQYDFMLQQLVADRDLGTLDVLPVYLFVNGEFYAEAYLRERYDKQFFEAHYGVDREDLILISNNQLDYGTEADYADYLALMDYVHTHDCSDPSVWAEICRQIDVQSLLDYLAVNFYCNNIDWRFEKNYKLWRTRSAGGEGVLDGRWRWLAYDTDAVGWAYSWAGEELKAIDPFSQKLPWVKDADNKLTYLEMPLFSDLLKNPEFKTRFIQTYLDLMNVNFNVRHAAPLLEKFGLTDHWLWTPFLTERPPYALDNLIRAMESDAAPCALTLRVSDPAGGTARLNTAVPDLSGGSWAGTWLTGVPLTLTAEPAPGWRFVRWEGAASGTEPEITLTPAGDAALTAVFEKNSDK